MSDSDCPRGVSSFKYLNKPDDGTCDYCGSLLPDLFMARLELGDVELGPTDKSYKVYVHNKGGEQFKRTHRIDRQVSEPGQVLRDMSDQSQWVWETVFHDTAKFYFEHLSTEQMDRFIELLNQKKLNIRVPGYFYTLPYFICKPSSSP